MRCCECKHFFTKRCNGDHFPGDEACGDFDAVRYLSRKEQIFSELHKKLSSMDNETLILETLEHCRMFMLNTSAGQYLFEFMKRLDARKEKNSNAI